MSALHDFAAAVGLHVDWEDAMGEPQHVSDEALKAILEALGFPANSEAAIRDSRHRLAEDIEVECAFVSATRGEPINLPPRCGSPGRAELALEDGSTRTVVVEESGGGLSIAPVDAAGYHRIRVGDREIMLAVAPERCFRVQDAVPGKRIWGPSVQIPALRDDRQTGFGDFASLADAARAFASRGADALAISPVHALFPADCSRFSPYAPSSRLFLNILYGDPGLIGLPLPAQPSPDLIDWEKAIPERVRLLRQAFETAGECVRDRVEAYRHKAGEELERHARFDALHAHFFRTSGATGWQGWPEAYQDPAGTAVERFAAEQAEEVRFYVFLQWLAKRSLDEAQKAATDAGMAVGLIADLAVGMDGGGSHAWSRREELLTGLSIGAPPDLLGPDGQAWGITGFSPHALRRTGFAAYLATLRAALDHAGGIRIDHALGLRRLWVVPDGASAAEGAYLQMPMDDMLRLLALESHRTKAIVIGEDLGTVPEGFRPAMDQKAMLGMRVLWFERDEDGAFVPPARWPLDAAAMTGTHDLPTVAGWWRGRDIDWTWKLGRTSRAADEGEDRSKREEERKLLWGTFQEAGAAEGDQPAPDEAEPVVTAAARFIGETPCVLAILPIEDVAGLVEQPNLPGTIDEHPNWRRRMPEPTSALLNKAEVTARLDALNAARSS
jgi:4-alpha-glucanotransferase